MRTYTVYVDGMAKGREVDCSIRFANKYLADTFARLQLEQNGSPGYRLSVNVWANQTRLERLSEGARWVSRKHYRYGFRIIAQSVRIGKMTTPYIDADTLAIAQLVADAEGITLAQALADQLELFGE